MEQKKANKKKVLTSALALTLAAAVGFGGTLAWQSVNQTALNEVSSEVNPGGRLHDDFNGENKDIYVENFTPEKGGVPIYARVKLVEYLEIGKGAGLLPGTEADGSDSEAYKNKRAQSLAPGAKINDESTWSTYHYTKDADETAKDPFRQYFTLNSGGKKVYMPTFNMNKDSLKSDINGTYGATKEENGKIVHYTDYKTYDDGKELEGTEIWDADANTKDEGDDATVLLPDKSNAADANVRHVVKKHTAKETKEATIYTMEEWKALDESKQKGDYWVWDTDGWAYWANPIEQESATGLLLDSIEEVTKGGSKKLYNYYYGLKAVAQFCTAGDWGAADNSGFFNLEKGEYPSMDAQKLLSKITDSKIVTISPYQPAAGTDLFNANTSATYIRTDAVVTPSIYTGNCFFFTTNTNVLGKEDTKDTYEYTLEGNTQDGNPTSSKTKLGDANTSYYPAGTKYLIVGEDETATEVTIVAKSKNTGVESRLTVKVGTWMDEVQKTPVGGTVISADGVSLRVLAQDTANRRTLAISNGAYTLPTNYTSSYSSSSSDVSYTNSNLKKAYDAWLDGKTELKKAAKASEIYTYNVRTQTYEASTEKVFPLTMADLSGKTQTNPMGTASFTWANLTSTTESKDYTYNNQVLLPYDSLAFKNLFSNGSYLSWLRNTVTGSSTSITGVVAGVNSVSYNVSTTYTSDSLKLMPCMWLDWDASLD